jgi:hypothetical protein
MPTIAAPTAPITPTEDVIQTPASSLLDVAVANAKHRVLVPEAMLDGAPEDTQERAAAPRLPAASEVLQQAPMPVLLVRPSGPPV